MQKILLLEDDATLGNGIVLALNSESSEITLCSTLSEARKAYRHGAFQLLIIDINLPDGNGLDFLREVRRLVPRRFQIPYRRTIQRTQR